MTNILFDKLIMEVATKLQKYIRYNQLSFEEYARAVSDS